MWSDFKEVQCTVCYGDYTCRNIDDNYLLQFGKSKSILKKMGHGKLVGLGVKRFIFLEEELP